MKPNDRLVKEAVKGAVGATIAEEVQAIVAKETGASCASERTN